MTIERPGRPGNLPAAELLWSRWALAAVMEATAAAEARTRRHGSWISEEGLRLDDSGCTWWTLTPLGEGRYVLYGEDESSEVRWHDRPVDVLSGAPDWLPHDRLRELLDEIGCVYWYENGAWNRAPYPEDLRDDGLDCGMSRFADRDEALRDLAASERCPSRAHAADLLAAAESRTLTAPVIEAALDAASPLTDEDRQAVHRALHASALTPAP
ncbi:hypothetical protein [Streptomyces sp. NPDC097619]|uniref:hypothetical protein n=1 Tax=Streptomyces sp. NPDC097619 TaxID=3157228 RepID=UPI0033305EA0